MSRDEVRKLIGGYATGSLTESERKLLFDAALDDQDLFDELAAEQEMKDLLDQPGVKQRLIGALTPEPKRAVWARPWAWVAAAAAAVLIVTLAIPRRPAPREIAEVRAPQVRSVPSPAPAIDQATPRVEAPAPEPVRKKTVTPERDSATVAEPLSKTNKDEAAANEPVLDQRQQAQAAGAPPAARPRAAEAVGALGGFPPQSANAFRTAEKVAAPPRFAFDYAVVDGKLRVTPSANGFLNVGFAGGASTAAVSNRAVQAGVASEVDLPADATSADVTLSARPLPPNRSISLLFDPNAPLSGTAAAPNASPDAQVTVILPLKR